MSDFQFNAVLVCEDVRKEQNNKEILIGVYGSDIHVSALPSNIFLSFWMEVTSTVKGPFQLVLRVQAPNPDEKFEIRMDGDAYEARSQFTFHTPPVPYPIDREGDLKLFAKAPGSDKFELIKVKKVRYVPAFMSVPSGRDRGRDRVIA